MDELDEIKDEMKEDDEVGYGKPPTKNQFVKGKSGNPKGRPKGSKNMQTTVRNLLDELVVVKANGRATKMSNTEALLRRLINQAHSGDRFATRELLNLRIRYDNPEQLEVASPERQRQNAASLESLMRRLKRIAADSIESESTPQTLSEPEAE